VDCNRSRIVQCKTSNSPDDNNTSQQPQPSIYRLYLAKDRLKKVTDLIFVKKKKKKKNKNVLYKKVKFFVL
jgi:hypothetical protein